MQEHIFRQREKMRISTSLIIIGILGVILGIALTNAFQDYNWPFSDKDCKNLSIKDASMCLRNSLSEWYFYNISNLNDNYNCYTDKTCNVNYDKLKKSGGVCWQAAAWYVDKAKELNYNAKFVTININESIRHTFAVISDDEGYCLLDQTIKPLCVKVAR